MVYGFESDVKIDDEILKQEFGSTATYSLKHCPDDSERANAIIRNTKDKILVIQEQREVGRHRWHFTELPICFITIERI